MAQRNYESQLSLNSNREGYLVEKIAQGAYPRRSGDVEKRSLSIEARGKSISILSDCELCPVGRTPKDRGATCLVSCVFQSTTSVCHASSCHASSQFGGKASHLRQLRLQLQGIVPELLPIFIS